MQGTGNRKPGIRSGWAQFTEQARVGGREIGCCDVVGQGSSHQNDHQDSSNRHPDSKSLYDVGIASRLYQNQAKAHYFAISSIFNWCLSCDKHPLDASLLYMRAHHNSYLLLLPFISVCKLTWAKSSAPKSEVHIPQSSPDRSDLNQCPPMK